MALKTHVGVPTLGPGEGSFGKPGLMSAPLLELAQKLGSRSKSEREYVASRGKEVLPDIIMVLRMGTNYNRACALACMIKMDNDGTDCREALPELRGLFKSGDGYVKGYSANLLGRMEDKESIPEIAKGLADMDHVVRLYSSAALEALGPASIGALVKARGGRNEFARREARGILARISNSHPGSVPGEVLAAIGRETAEEIVRKTHGIVRLKQLDAEAIS